MAVLDPIADMLTRIRNAIMVKHDSVLVPASRMKLAVARLLKEEGFIEDYEVVKDKTHRMIKIRIKYLGKDQPAISGLERISKPGLRVYVGQKEIPRVYGGLGVAFISTPRGVLTGQQARRQGVGGELLCYIW
ncbi:MAG: 30S ribosomal protein S8 [Chloroflexi bacterium]|nr:30S ribosomal protein S8 [Chloroflexota bacterium]